MDTFNNPRDFGKEVSFDKKRADVHSKELGYEVPKDYFIQSKKEILNKVSARKKSNVVHFMNRNTFIMVAASLTILITLVVFQMKNNSLKENTQLIATTEHALTTENEDLVTSLFLEENDLIDEVDYYVHLKVVEDL